MPYADILQIRNRHSFVDLLFFNFDRKNASIKRRKLATRETFREAVLRRIISVEENILAKMIFFFFVGKSVMLAGWRDDTTIRENALKNTGLNQPDVYPPRNISMKRSFIRISGWLPGLLRI